MNCSNQDPFDSDDSDIKEVTIIPSKDADTAPRCPSPVAKRRRSSPQMDPIPSYTPTPIHLLKSQQRNRTIGTSSEYTDTNDSPYYNPSFQGNNYSFNSNLSPSPDGSSPYTESISISKDEYTPLLHPNPDVVGAESSCESSPPRSMSRLTHATITPVISQTTRTSRRTASTRNFNTARPVINAVAEAIARTRTLSNSEAVSAATAYHDTAPSSSDYAEKPVMWSPKLPSQIEAVKDEEAEREKARAQEERNKLVLPKTQKTRVAHRPTIPKNKQNRPKVPLGTAKKVPQSFRVKYLDVIINEYLNTSHKEEESYEQALKDEQSIATRAANKSIYVNLVAGLKKKIRESAGISSKQADDDQKYVNGNKIISHDEILTGRVIGTYSIERRRKND